MKSRFFPLLGTMVFFAVTFLVGIFIVSGQSEQQYNTGMRWEYISLTYMQLPSTNMVELSQGIPGDIMVFTDAEHPEYDNPFNCPPPNNICEEQNSVTSYLNILGNDGWELVSFETFRDFTTYLLTYSAILKRPSALIPNT